MEAIFCINVTMPDGTELEDVRVEVDFDAVYEQERTADQMDRCCPAYSEMTLNGVDVDQDCQDGDGNVFSSFAVGLRVLEKYQDKIKDLCWEYFHASRYEGRED